MATPLGETPDLVNERLAEILVRPLRRLEKAARPRLVVRIGLAGADVAVQLGGDGRPGIDHGGMVLAAGVPGSHVSELTRANDRNGGMALVASRSSHLSAAR